MTHSRRDFLSTGVKAGVAASLVGGLSPKTLLAEDQPSAVRPSSRRANLKILILGGTGVTGPHLVARALEQGHEVTTFTRGRTQPSVNAEYFEHVEQLVGDRADDLEALGSGTWDVVIDNSGRDVAWTTASTGDRAGWCR